MKKILITGVNSYVGNSLEDWLAQYPNDYKVDKVSVRDDCWKEKDFSNYDSIVHVAGIAHQKETEANKADYYKVNRDLAIDLAGKAKREKVNQFIFLSTMSVYGLDTGVITEKTPLKPKTHYGKSKLEAESAITKLQSEQFKVAIVRPPMIYGKDCPGNYQRLRWLALKTPIFPDIDNKRSMIYVDNLSEFLRQLINSSSIGVYCPQNEKLVNTTNLVLEISKAHHKKIKTVRLFNIFIKSLSIPLFKKVFGDLYYKIDENDINYDTCDFPESVRMSEKAVK